jgi:hypothetical protein
MGPSASILDTSESGLSGSPAVKPAKALKHWLADAWPDARPLQAQRGFVFDALLIVVAWALVSIRFVTGQFFIPWDSPDGNFPQTRFVVNAIRTGHAPWWNPYIYGGQPVLGDPQGMIFTPQALVGLIVWPHFNQYIFDMTALVTVLCGGIALARYARAYSDSRTLPILGALVFIAGGVATSRLQHTPQIASYGLLPIQLLALRAVCLRPSILRTLLLAVLITAGALNPNQVTFLSSIGFVPFVVLHLYQSRRRVAALLSLAVAAVIVLVAVAPMLSAILEFVSLSTRPTTDIAESYGSSFPLFSILSIFMPGLFGVMTPLNGYWPPTDLTQDYLYIGIVPAAVFLASLFWLRRGPAVIVLCWVSIVVWYVFAMGMNTPVYPFLFHHVPGFAEFRRPADAAYLVNMFIGVLIGSCRLPTRARLASWPVSAIVATIMAIAGAELLARLTVYAVGRGHGSDLLVVLRAFSWRAALVVAIVLAALRIDRRAVRWLAAPLLIGLTVLDLASAGRARSVFGSPVAGSDLAQVYSGTLSWAKPRNSLEESITFLQQNGAGGPNLSWRMEALGGGLAGNMPMAFGILTTQGYDPLKLATFDHDIGAEFGLQNGAKVFTSVSPSYDSPDYRRLGLRYVLFHRYIADHTKEFGDFGAAIDRIKADFIAHDFGRQLPVPGLYEVWELRNAMARANVVAADGSQQPCDIVAFGTVSLTVQCHAAAPGRLVLGDSYAPGWRACVNGNPVPVEPFEDIFRSVAVPQGDSRTEFRYQAVPFLRTAASCPAS